MDCRTFRRNHQAFIDDTLPGVEMAEMQQHLEVCARCAHQDANVRRALMLLRNLPPIAPSSGFADRLRARLSHEARRVQQREAAPRGPSIGAFARTAASVVTLGAVFALILRAEASEQTPHPRLPAVVASPAITIDIPSESIATPAFVTSMSTGMPVWPALLLADEGSLRFATTELEAASWTPDQGRE
ncbi:MAG TPA: zf-HC2 domain-containing protein [Gemmatimonadaceae bacterium]